MLCSLRCKPKFISLFYNLISHKVKVIPVLNKDFLGFVGVLNMCLITGSFGKLF